MTQIGRVGELWRYPVKSMRGERLPAVHVEDRGFVGDRLFAVYDADGKIGSGKITRRFRAIAGLRTHSARTDPSGIVIESNGQAVARTHAPAVDAAMSKSLGQPVTVRREADVAHHDAAPVHLLSVSSLTEMSARVGRALDAFPFRPNIVLETRSGWPAEETWIGRVIAIGDLRLRISERTERCIMVNRLSDGSTDPQIIQTIVRANDACLGVYARVEMPGDIREGDVITFAD